MDQPRDEWTFWSMDTPAGPLLIAPCLHPEATAERPDVPLDVFCHVHNRTWYWCLDKSEAWCDGGPPDYHWHEGELVAVDYSVTKETAD